MTENSLSNFRKIVISIFIIDYILIVYLFTDRIYGKKNTKFEFNDNTINESKENNGISEINNIVIIEEPIKEPIKELKYIGTLKKYNVIAKLEIPKINLVIDVLDMCNEDSLKVSVAKFFGPNPNEKGNFCISGHNYKRNSRDMFVNLKKLVVGDNIILTDGYDRQLKYEIYDIFDVKPNETEGLSQYTEGRCEITLITCTSNNKERIIVKATEVLIH